MAIIGDGFVDYVKNQITRRQQALGEYDNRNIKNTMAFMTRTPWARMVSSVDLEEGKPEYPGNSVLTTIQKSSLLIILYFCIIHYRLHNNHSRNCSVSKL